MGTWQEYSSYFIPRKALFGSFPDEEKVSELVDIGVRYFVDLTQSYEIAEKYHQKENFLHSWINFPISDRKVPTNIPRYAGFIGMLLNTLSQLEEDEKIYIHCRGGHGRAGVVVATLLSITNDIGTTESLALTNTCHNERTVMREKWRSIGSPQTRGQKIFVHKFLSDMVFFRAYKSGPSHGFSTYSDHSIVSSEENGLPLGTFPSAEALFQASRNSDYDYHCKQMRAKSPSISRKLGEKSETDDKWNERTEQLMIKIQQLKFKQYPHALENLQFTGRRNIIFNSRKDLFFGIGSGNGKNKLGKILMKIREDSTTGMFNWNKRRKGEE